MEVQSVGAAYFDKIRAAYDQHSGMVFRLCLSILKDPEKAHDAVQDCFTRLCTTARRYDDVDTPLICRTAINICIDHLRRRSIELSGYQHLYELSMSREHSGWDTLGTMVACEEAKVVCDYIDQCEPVEQDILGLYYGLPPFDHTPSPKAISNMLGLDINVVRRIIARHAGSMRTRVRELGLPPGEPGEHDMWRFLLKEISGMKNGEISSRLKALCPGGRFDESLVSCALRHRRDKGGRPLSAIHLQAFSRLCIDNYSPGKWEQMRRVIEERFSLTVERSRMLVNAFWHQAFKRSAFVVGGNGNG